MKRLIAFVCTVLILSILFWKVDRAALVANLRATRLDYFSLALFMFIPQFWAITLRWRMLVSVFVHITWMEGLSLVLASQTLNIGLPSKAGDLSKAVFLKQMGRLSLKRATNVVVFEKLLDVGALATFMLIGVAAMLSRGAVDPIVRHAGVVAGCFGVIAVAAVIVLYFVPVEMLPGFAWFLETISRYPKLKKLHGLFVASHETMTLLQSRGAHRWIIVAISGLIWIFHLIQIWLFFISLNAPVPLPQLFSLVPLAIFMGLIPITISGFGTRDVAIIKFFPQYPASTMLGVAMFINLRMFIPAIAGIPFLSRCITYTKNTTTNPGDESTDQTAHAE